MITHWADSGLNALCDSKDSYPETGLKGEEDGDSKNIVTV